MNDMPKGNQWDFIDRDDKSMYYGKNFRFDFNMFEAEQIRMLIKFYVWQNYKTGAVALRTIHTHCSSFRYFNTFCIENKIESLVNIDTNTIDEYMTFLRLYKASRTGRTLKYVTQSGIFSTFKMLVHWGQMYVPHLVPHREIFSGNEYSMINVKHKIEYIPDDVLVQIQDALKVEENPYIKYGLIILMSTGLRRSELMNLKVNCVTPHALKGYTLTLYDFKNRRDVRKLPIPPMCAEAIRMLEEVTAEIRKEAGDELKPYLFLYRTSRCGIANEIRVISGPTFTKWMNGYLQKGKYYSGFMSKHNIVGSDGEIYKIKIHQFRKTVATDMFSKNVDLKVIQEFLRHSDPGTTKKYYADSKDIDRARLFEKINIIGNIDNIDSDVFENEKELSWFNNNKHKAAKMCDGYCTMPLKKGKICERLIKHQKCYTCSRYITTPEYLKAHKEHLAELEAELANNIYGSHYANHLLPTISVLKIIIEKLEAIDNAE